MKNDFSVTAIHGFAGLPSDWDAFPEITNKINLWKLPAHAFSSLEVGAREIIKLTSSSTSDRQARPPILLGYSLGGRLALHALNLEPKRWAGAILVSTNPGLETHAERTQRLVHDAEWAQRWESDLWSSVWQDWNGQAIFNGPKSKSSQLPNRSEVDFDRRVLAQAMRGWSLGHQADLRSKALALNVPVLWLAGELDLKFVNLQNRLQSQASFKGNPQPRFEVAANAGHRLPWDQPQSFAKSIRHFVDSLPIIS